MGDFGLGWQANPVDERDLDVDAMGLSSDTTGASCSLSGLVSCILNQRSTQSCVAQMAAAAIDILETKNELPYVPASRLFMYYNSRAYHYMQSSDSGTFIRACMKGLQKYGVPNEEHWEFTTDQNIINRRPGWEPYTLGHSRKDGVYNWIKDSGQGRVKAIKAALLSGYPVGFGTLVTEDFKRRKGPSVVDLPLDGGGFAGGHAMLIVGFDETPQGLVFEVLNSWGTSWRNGGFVNLTEDYIRWQFAKDFCIVHGWSRLDSGK